MWNYEKRLEYPVKITQTNPKLAQMIISQYGGSYCRCLQFSVPTEPDTAFISAAFVKYPCKHGYFPHCSRE